MSKNFYRIPLHFNQKPKQYLATFNPGDLKDKNISQLKININLKSVIISEKKLLLYSEKPFFKERMRYIPLKEKMYQNFSKNSNIIYIFLFELCIFFYNRGY